MNIVVFGANGPTGRLVSQLALEQGHAVRAVARSPEPTGLAVKTVRAIRKNRPLVRYGADAYVFSLLRLLPLWLVDPFGRFLGRKALRIVRGEETI